MRLFRQEYWSGLPYPPLGNLPNPGIKPTSLTSPPLAGVSLPPVPPGKPSLLQSDTRRKLDYNGKTHNIINRMKYAAAATSLQLCPTLCDPTDGTPPGSTVPGILQARTLEWVAISFSNAWKWNRSVTTQWTAAHQAPPSMGFSRQEYWSGVPLPSPRMKYRLILILF